MANLRSRSEQFCGDYVVRSKRSGNDVSRSEFSDVSRQIKSSALQIYIGVYEPLNARAESV